MNAAVCNNEQNKNIYIQGGTTFRQKEYKNLHVPLGYFVTSCRKAQCFASGTRITSSTCIYLSQIYVYGSVHRWSILIIVQRDATQNSLFIILQFHYTCFGCQPHPSSEVHKTVTTASGTGPFFLCSYLPPTWPSLATSEGSSCTKNMTSTGGCSYSFVYSWWWEWLTSETCRVNLRNNKKTALCCILFKI